MSEGGIVLEEVSQWFSYEPEAGRRAFSITTPNDVTIVVEMSTVTKMITKVLRADPMFGILRQIHRADWYRHLDGSRLEALQRALG